jgi:hypothetical protein
MKPQTTLEDMMKQGVTHLLNGREVILAPYNNGNMKRIGWVYKDTGLPPTDKDVEQAEERNAQE